MPLPSYTFLSDQSWCVKIAAADALASVCALCPRRCGVDRLKNQKGFCEAGSTLTISSVFPHHGEEPPLSGSGGSGTIFFSHCTLHCCFCQNHQISHEGEGAPYTVEALAHKMMELQSLGCHNVNLVTATHFLPWVLRALKESVKIGLNVPIVYNCGGYETVETIEILRDIVDIWLPDIKYGDNTAAQKYSRAPDYVEVNHAAIRAMFRQVGRLRVDKNNVGVRGLIIRHLVLPSGLSGSESVVRWLLSLFDPDDITISLMAQYFPAYHSKDFPEINRRITRAEYEPVAALFANSGFAGFFQEVEDAVGAFKIDFKQRKDSPLTGENQHAK